MHAGRDTYTHARIPRISYHAHQNLAERRRKLEKDTEAASKLLMSARTDKALLLHRIYSDLRSLIIFPPPVLPYLRPCAFRGCANACMTARGLRVCSCGRKRRVNVFIAAVPITVNQRIFRVTLAYYISTVLYSPIAHAPSNFLEPACVVMICVSMSVCARTCVTLQKRW